MAPGRSGRDIQRARIKGPIHKNNLRQNPNPTTSPIGGYQFGEGPPLPKVDCQPTPLLTPPPKGVDNSRQPLVAQAHKAHLGVAKPGILTLLLLNAPCEYRKS